MPAIGSDQITIVDLTDGYSVTLSPEAYAFPAGTTAALAGSITTTVSALVGKDPAPASVVVSEIQAPSGLTVTSDNNTTAPTLTITIATSVTQPGVIVIPVHVNDVVINKRFAYSLAKSGAAGSPGTSATNVVVGNEDVTFVTDSTGATVGTSTVTIPFAGYVGSSRTATTVAVGTLPTGITVGTNTAATTSADGSLTLNVASGSTLGGTTSGTINLTFTANGQTFARLFTWSKALAGTAGAAGKDAIVVAVTSSNGTIFKNSSIATTLTARVYKGGVEQNASQIAALGTVKWYKDGGNTAVNTGVTYVLDPGMVTGKASYVAQLEA